MSIKIINHGKVTINFSITGILCQTEVSPGRTLPHCPYFPVLL